MDSFSKTINEIKSIFFAWGFSNYYAVLFWKYLHQKQIWDVEKMVDLRYELREKIIGNFYIEPLSESLKLESKDNLTIKYLLKMKDGAEIESVYMRYQNRVTGCFSTQVGCAMGCVFCATGQMGFSRNLSAGEIVLQALHIDREAKKENKKLRNIVLMGMGEPLHNYVEVKKAIEIISHQQGLNIAGKHITLSTVGLVPEIYRMADDKLPVRLAVSLHGSTDEERQRLVPVARKWSLSELMDACKYYTEKMGWHIFFEWTLINGENDSVAVAERLGLLLKDIPAHVNLIPLNPVGGYDGEPSNKLAISKFQSKLREYGIPSTLRQRRGIDINAGCGQLKKNQTITLN